MYNFDKLKKDIQATTEWFIKELATVRTGRASAAILDNVFVEVYGAKSPLNQVANVGVEDAKTVRVSPWDKSQVGAIEKAITLADLGVSVASDSNGVRVIFPDMTTERRTEMSKIADKKLEEGRIRLRQVREDVWGDIQAQEKEGAIAEDDKFRAKEDMQKIIDEANATFEGLAKKKREELMS